MHPLTDGSGYNTVYIVVFQHLFVDDDIPRDHELPLRRDPDLIGLGVWFETTKYTFD
jgi:hypothetical protein